jgi:hypothetical protein
MSKFTKILKVLGGVGIVVVAGILLGWLGSRNPQPAPASADAGTSPGGGSNATRAALAPTNRMAVVSKHPLAGTVGSQEPAGSNLLTNWEDNIDEILTSEAPEAEKARKMADLFPRLPENGQVEVAQHLSNLVSDQDYSSLSRFVTNSALPAPVLDVLVADALNRPNSLKLPTLLEVARDPQNPKAGEAKDVLHLFLEEDYGTDWAAWQAKVEQWLKDNPD